MGKRDGERVRAPPSWWTEVMDKRLGRSSHVSGLFLCRWLLFAALSADQRQVVFRVKRVATSGLLSGGTQGDVYASIVGQDHHPQIIPHLLSVVRRQIGILRYLFFYLFCVQIILFAKGSSLDGGCGNAMFNQVIPGTFYATFCQAFIVFRQTAFIRVATENQMGLWPEPQVFFEICCQRGQNLLLAREQAAAGTLRRRPSGLKIDAVKSQSRFKLDHFRWRWRFLHSDC